jgi:hypothetical protein
MAKVEILFTGSLLSDTIDTTIICKKNKDNELDIEISNDSENYGVITLDKETAIKLVKQLKKAIGQLN